MMSLATYERIDPDRLAAFSGRLVGMLEDDLGFRGIVMSGQSWRGGTDRDRHTRRALSSTRAAT